MTSGTGSYGAMFWLVMRFGIVGLGSVAVYFVVLYLLRPVISGTITLTATAYVISAVFNFVLQNFFTFRMQSVGPGKVVRYCLMHGLCMGINSGMMYGLVDLAGLHLYLAQVITTTHVAVISFLLSKYFVYRD